MDKITKWLLETRHFSPRFLEQKRPQRLKDFYLLFNFHAGFKSAILALFHRGLRWLCPVSTSTQKGLTGNLQFLVRMEAKIRKCLLMPCPFTRPKMFWAGPSFLCQTKNLLTYCGSHRHFVPDKKMI